MAGKVLRYQFKVEKGYLRRLQFVNSVSINKSYKVTLVNYLEYEEIDQKGNQYVNTLKTDIQLSPENVAKLMRGGNDR